MSARPHPLDGIDWPKFAEGLAKHLEDERKAKEEADRKAREEADSKAKTAIKQQQPPPNQEALIAQRDAKIANQEALIAQRDAKIANQDAVIAQRDAKIANQDAVIAQLKQQVSVLEAEVARSKPSAWDRDVPYVWNPQLFPTGTHRTSISVQNPAPANAA